MEKCKKKIRANIQNNIDLESSGKTDMLIPT